MAVFTFVMLKSEPASHPDRGVVDGRRPRSQATRTARYNEVLALKQDIDVPGMVLAVKESRDGTMGAVKHGPRWDAERAGFALAPRNPKGVTAAQCKAYKDADPTNWYWQAGDQ